MKVLSPPLVVIMHHAADRQHVVAGRHLAQREGALARRPRRAAHQHQHAVGRLGNRGDHRPFHRTPLRVEHDPANPHVARGNEREVDTLRILPDVHREPLRLAGRRRAREVGGNEPRRGRGAGRLRAHCRPSHATNRRGHDVVHHAFGARRGRHVVVTGREAIQPVLTEIVGLREAPGAHQRTAAVRPAHALRHDLGVGDRLAEFVDDASCDDAAARERDVGLLDHLPVGELDLACRPRTAASDRTARRRSRPSRR